MVRSVVVLAAVSIAACYPVEEAPRRRPPVVRDASRVGEPALVTPVSPGPGAETPGLASTRSAATTTAPSVGVPSAPAARSLPPPMPRPPAAQATRAVPAEAATPKPPTVRPSAPAAPTPAPAPSGPVTAGKAPGRPGYVISPHTGKLMLVRGIPSGTIVPDQTCPPNEAHVFRVP